MPMRATLIAGSIIATLVLGGSDSTGAGTTVPEPPPIQPVVEETPGPPPEPDHGPTEVPSIVPWEDGTRLSVPRADPMARQGVTPPVWNLPFEANLQWYSGGPHADSDGTARGAVDFTPASSPNKRIVAIASGRVYLLQCRAGWFLGVDHGNGWKSEYYHLTNAQIGLVGSWITTGTYLGEAGNTLPCGGSSNGPHVHLSILYGDVPQPSPGVMRPYYPVSGMQFGGYVVTAGSAAYSGTWRTLGGATVITNWGCCLTSTTAVPTGFTSAPTPAVTGANRVGATLTATVGAWSPTPTLVLQWRRNGVAIPGATGSTYVVTKPDRGAGLSISVEARREGTLTAQRTSNTIAIESPATRLAGADRYATSAAISAATFGSRVPVVYLATGERFPDALSGAAAAGASGGPVLLVTRDSIPGAVATELRRLEPQRIVLVGGEQVLSDRIATAAADFSLGAVTRLAGVDRSATSAAVSAATFAPGVHVAYLATGADFADALSVAAVAGASGTPVLLTDRNSLTPAVVAELRRLAPDRIVVVGGTERVAASVLSEAAGYTTGAVSRIAGSDRFETAALIAGSGIAPPVDQVYLAQGYDFADALSGAAAAAATGSRVLLTPTSTLVPATQQAITTLQPARVRILGGPAAIADETARFAGTFAR